MNLKKIRSFKFDPDVVRSLLFPDPDADEDEQERERGNGHRPRKRRRRDPDIEGVKDPEPEPMPMPETRDMILENDVDRYLVLRCKDGETDDSARQYRILAMTAPESVANGISSKEDSPCGSTMVTDSPSADKQPTPDIQQHDATPSDSAADAVPPPSKTLTPAPTPALHDVATALEEGDIQFLPNGVRIAPRKLVSAADSAQDENALGRFVAVLRWRWHSDG